METKTTTPKTTNVFTILNEDKMEIVKQTIRLKENIKYEMPMIFATEQSIDTDSVHLNVKIRFADKWDMDFVWTMNNKTNWVHTNAEPTHFNNVEIDEDIKLDLAAQNAKRIMLHFDFEEQEILIGEEIEDRKHHIS